ASISDTSWSMSSTARPSCSMIWSSSFRLRERHRYRRGDRIAVAMEIDDDAIETEAQPLGHRLDDAPVGLMRDQPGEIGGRHVVALQDFLGHFGHADDGGLVHSRPILHEVVPSLRD